MTRGWGRRFAAEQVQVLVPAELTAGSRGGSSSGRSGGGGQVRPGHADGAGQLEYLAPGGMGHGWAWHPWPLPLTQVLKDHPYGLDKTGGRAVASRRALRRGRAVGPDPVESGRPHRDNDVVRLWTTDNFDERVADRPRRMQRSSTSGSTPTRLAQADYDVVKALHMVDAIGTFDAAVVTKDADGKVHVAKDETATRSGGWAGAGVGALVGILFPQAIIGAAVVGGTVGAVGGHLWKGMSRSDVKELGDLIDSGEAALVVIGDLTISEAIGGRTARAQGVQAPGGCLRQRTSRRRSRRRTPDLAALGIRTA